MFVQSRAIAILLRMPVQQSEVAITPFAPEMWGLGGWRLGASYDPNENITSFAVQAPDATRVLLEIYPAELGADAPA